MSWPDDLGPVKTNALQKDTQEALAAVKHGHAGEESSQLDKEQANCDRQRYHQPANTINGWITGNEWISEMNQSESKLLWLTSSPAHYTPLLWTPRADWPSHYFPVRNKKENAALILLITQKPTVYHFIAWYDNDSKLLKHEFIMQYFDVSSARLGTLLKTGCQNLKRHSLYANK